MSTYEPRLGQRLSRKTKKRLAERYRGEWDDERRRKISEGVRKALEKRRTK